MMEEEKELYKAIAEEFYQEKEKPDGYQVVYNPTPQPVHYTQEYVNERLTAFLDEIETRNSWGKNQIKEVFLKTMLGLK